MNFLSSFHLALTPISPLHIGCGEDWEPTQYLIDKDDGCSFCFDPFKAELSQAEAAAFCKETVKCEDAVAVLQCVQRFMKQHDDLYIACTDRVLPWISPAFANDADDLLSSLATKKKLTIARQSYCMKSGRSEPYVPGSSLKGALHTALLDATDFAGEKPTNGKKLDEAIFGGTFGKSPMSTLSISDFMPAGHIETQLSCMKRIQVKDLQTISMKAYFEAVCAGQYRSFDGMISMQTARADKAGIAGAPTSAEQIFKALNRYFRPLFLKEIERNRHSRKIGTQRWSDIAAGLIPIIDRCGSRLALVRLGRYSGSAAMVLHRNAVPKIKIHPKKNLYSEEATTAAIAEEAFGDFDAQLPCGWCLLELISDQAAGIPAAEEICSKIKEGSAWSHFDCSAILKAKQEAAKIKLDKRRAEERAALEKQKQQEEEEKMLQALPPEEREIAELVKKIKGAGKVKPGSELAALVLNVLKKAKAQWSKTEQHSLADQLGPMAKSRLSEGKIGKEVKVLLRELRND